MKATMAANAFCNDMDMMNELDETLEFLQDALFDENLTVGMAIEFNTIGESRENTVVSPTSSIDDAGGLSETEPSLCTSTSSSTLSEKAESASGPPSPKAEKPCFTEQEPSVSVTVEAAPSVVPSAPLSTTQTTKTRAPQLFGKAASCVPIAPCPPKSTSSPDIAASSTLKSATSSNPKRSAARNTFLRAVAVAVAEQRVGPDAKPNKAKLSAEEQFHKQRERNRFLAKQTRERKKVAMSSLKDQFAALQLENQRLRTIVQEHLPATAMQSLLAQNTAVLDKIPQVVWDACGCDPTNASPSSTGTKRKSSTPAASQPEPLQVPSMSAEAPTKKPRLSAPLPSAPALPVLVVTQTPPPTQRADQATSSPKTPPPVNTADKDQLTVATAAPSSSTTDVPKDGEADGVLKSMTGFSIPNPLAVIG